jgi:hypothetical protein
MRLKGYDEWKTRSDLDDALRYEAPPDRCFFCDAPFPEGYVPWSFWSSAGVTASLCDDCAPANGEADQDA